MKLMIAAVVAVPLLAVTQDAPKPPSSMSGREILSWMERHSDRKFAIDEVQLGRHLAERKVVISDGVLAADRAYEVGLSLLRTLGLAAVPAGGTAVKIVQAQQARVETLPVWTSVSDLPKADEFGVLLIPIRNLQAQSLFMALSNLAGSQVIVPHAEARSISVVDYASNCRKVAQIVAELDARAASTPIRIRVAAIEGTPGAFAAPDEFRDTGLAKAAGATAFGPASEATLRLDAEERPGNRPPACEGMIRLGTARPLSVEFSATAGADGRVVLDRFVVRQDADRAAAGPRLIETRLDLREDGWTLVGCAPVDKSGAVVAILVKAERVNR